MKSIVTNLITDRVVGYRECNCLKSEHQDSRRTRTVNAGLNTVFEKKRFHLSL